MKGTRESPAPGHTSAVDPGCGQKAEDLSGTGLGDRKSCRPDDETSRPKESRQDVGKDVGGRDRREGSQRPEAEQRERERRDS